MLVTKRALQICLIAVAALATGGSARANNITVTTLTAPNTAGDGKCGLIEAIRASLARAPFDACPAGSGVDTILLSAGTYTLVDFQGMEIYSDQITFQGTGMNDTILVSPNVSDPTFPTGLTSADCGFRQAATYISSSATVTFNDLTIEPSSGLTTEGFCLSSGTLTLNRVRVTGFQARGIWAVWSASSNGSSITLTVDHSRIDGNHAFDDGEGGGGIFYGEWDQPGTLKINQSSIINNSSDGIGGGISMLGSQFSNLRNIWNTTFSGNFAGDRGGAIYTGLNSYTQLDSLTIAFNRAVDVGGGIYKEPLTGNLTIYNSIVTNNTADADSQQANYSAGGDATNDSFTCNGTLFYLFGSEWSSSNRPSDTSTPPDSCEYGTAAGDVDAHLGSLVGKGGMNADNLNLNLPVHPLLSGSHAIDKVTNAQFTVDERDFVRPVAGVTTKLYDRGAYELHPLQLETESLTVAAKSSDTHAVVTDSGDSGGSGTNLQSNATNDFVTYRTGTIATGTYTVLVRFKKRSNAAKFRVAKADTLTGTYTNVGAEQDSYSSGNKWNTANLGTLTISTAGQKFFRFLVTGKNASSSSFQLYPDYIDLVK